MGEKRPQLRGPIPSGRAARSPIGSGLPIRPGLPIGPGIDRNVRGRGCNHRRRGCGCDYCDYRSGGQAHRHLTPDGDLSINLVRVLRKLLLDRLHNGDNFGRIGSRALQRLHEALHKIREGDRRWRVGLTHSGSTFSQKVSSLFDSNFPRRPLRLWQALLRSQAGRPLLVFVQPALGPIIKVLPEFIQAA